MFELNHASTLVAAVGLTQRNEWKNVSICRN